MTTGVVWDLDGTVIDTSGIQALREARRWRECARSAHKTSLFPGMERALADIAGSGHRLGLCTSAVSNYAQALLAHHKLGQFQAVVCYHDASPSKPHPAPIQKTLERMAVAPAAAVGIGDRVEDARAYHGAGLFSIGAGWNPALDRSAGWDFVAATPADAAATVLERLVRR